MQFFAACKKAPVFCIITEYLAGGSLRAYLHQQEPYSLPINLVLKFAIDIARGMQYLHSQGVLHRDLKSENLLLGGDMCVKVADFGISCLESQCGSAKGFTGTYRWMAPEMIKEKAHTKKVDVYSFGIVLWELLTALTPFDNMTPEQAAFAVCQKVLTTLNCTLSFSVEQNFNPNNLQQMHFVRIGIIILHGSYIMIFIAFYVAMSYISLVLMLHTHKIYQLSKQNKQVHMCGAINLSLAISRGCHLQVLQYTCIHCLVC